MNFLFLFKNQRQAGIPVVKNNLSGRATIQSTISSSSIAFLISPSPDVLEDKEPLARTIPAVPLGAK